MERVAVIIPTTQGLSRVQQIRIDEQLRHAVMTVNFRTERSTVTIDYAEYVARDAGIISRLTQEYRYRVKLSRDIITGSSWKLGMLAAHVLKQSDALAEVDTPFGDNATAAELVGDSERVVWATGDVSDEYGVLPVAQVKRKLELSQSLFEWCQKHSIPVKLYLPNVFDDDPHEHQANEMLLQKLARQFSVLSIQRLKQAPKRVQGWGVSNESSPRPAKDNSKSLMKPFVVVAAALTGAVALFMGVLNLGGETSELRDPETHQGSKSAHAAPKIEVSIFYDPTGDCFLNRGRFEEALVVLGEEPAQLVSLPTQAKTCRVDVLLAGSELGRWTMRAEGGAKLGDYFPIVLSQTRTEVRHPLYMARPQAIVFSPQNNTADINLEARIEISYTSSER